MFRRFDRSWWMLSWIFLALIAGAQEKDPQAASPAPKVTNDSQLLSVDRLFQSSEFQDRGWGPIQWRRDGKSYWIVDRNSASKSIAIQTVDAVTGDKVDFVSADELVRLSALGSISIRSMSPKTNPRCSFSPTPNVYGD